MIKKSFITLLILTLSLVVAGFNAYAQEEGFPVIAHTQGDVSMNLTGEEWEPAKKDVVLRAEALIKTGDQAYCNIAFDKDYKNIISIGANSEVKIGQYLKRVHISRGRVFSQLADLKEGSEFEVVTPVAIAGARGTSWETIVGVIVTFNVSNNTIYVQGIGKDGEVTGQIDVSEGFAVSVDENGWLGKLFKLLGEDNDRLEEWSDKLRTSLHSGLSQGNLNKLFAELLEKEMGSSAEAFASGGDGGFAGVLGNNSGSGPNILGGDIAPGTFGVSVVVKEDIPSSPTKPYHPSPPPGWQGPQP